LGFHGPKVKTYEYSYSRDIAVGIATSYAMNGRGIESRCGPWTLFSLLYNGYGVSFPGVKEPWCGVNDPPLFSAKVKERIQLYLYSASGFSWQVIRWILPFYEYSLRML